MDDYTHTCPAAGCERELRREMVMCTPHWIMVPEPVRAAVWNAAEGTPQHAAAINAAILAVGEKLARTAGVTAAGEHAGCPDTLRKALAAASARTGEPDMDLTVSTEPPLTGAGPGGWQPMSCTCPHGTAYWIEPTSEQIARWRAGGEP